MSLQFILGNSGSGKSHYLYQQIVNESMEHPEKNYLVLVPEQFTMQTQRDLCAAHPRGGIMNIDALSFMRLAYRVFEEVGREEQPVLDDEGKNLVIRRIAGKLEDDLKVLKGNLKKQGYISEVKSVISEFVQYGVDFDKLDDFMEGLSQESYLYYKLQDIRKVYEGFEEYLRDRYITKEEMLDVLARAVCDSELLKGSVIALDGFTGFTPVQIRLISELLKVSEKVIVTVEIDRREDPFIYRHPYQLFALSKQMVTSLVKTAQDAGAEVEEPVCLYEKVPYRFRENPEMAFLESELFRYSRRQYKKKKEESEACEGAVIEDMSDEELQDFVEGISVYARVSPEHKIRIVRAWQEKGNIVAMTGDGVIDAPALRQADIGVAMGVTGSEVAKDAAAMVLTDDNFATIVKAVENGRNLYQHIKNAIQFLLSGNFGAILVVLCASVAGLPVPFAPVHLLFINLLTDSLPAIALGVEPHSKAVMEQRPRPMSESILTKPYLLSIATEGVSIGVMTMAAFLIGYTSQNAALASTMAFGTLCMSRLVHGFNCKDDKPVIFTKRFFNNKYLIGAFVLGMILITSVLMIPGLHGMFKVVTLSLKQMMTVYGLALLNLPVIQGMKYLKER